MHSAGGLSSVPWAIAAYWSAQLEAVASVQLVDQSSEELWMLVQMVTSCVAWLAAGTFLNPLLVGQSKVEFCDFASASTNAHKEHIKALPPMSPSI